MGSVMQRKRVLAIAPDRAHLSEASQELNKISSLHDIEIVSGKSVTVAAVRNALRFAPKWDILWFIADSGWNHEENVGYMDLDGGATANDITSIVRASGCSLVILNSCQSVAIATLIAEQTNSDVISTLVDVNDKVASVFGMEMARLIADGASYFDAYRASRPSSNQSYVYLSSLVSMRDMDFQKPVDTPDGPVEILARILDGITSLRSDVYGWRLGVEGRLAALESKVFPPPITVGKRDFLFAAFAAVTVIALSILAGMYIR